MSQIVTGPPRTVYAVLPAREAARTMLSAGTEHLLVKSGERIPGTVHLADVCGRSLALPVGVAPCRGPAVQRRAGHVPARPELPRGT